MTTKKAFEKLISERAWYKPLEIPEGTANSYATRYRQGKLPIEKIEEILEKAGYTVKQEKLWNQPKK